MVNYNYILNGSVLKHIRSVTENVRLALGALS